MYYICKGLYCAVIDVYKCVYKERQTLRPLDQWTITSSNIVCIMYSITPHSLNRHIQDIQDLTQYFVIYYDFLSILMYNSIYLCDNKNNHISSFFLPSSLSSPIDSLTLLSGIPLPILLYYPKGFNLRFISVLTISNSCLAFPSTSAFSWARRIRYGMTSLTLP